MFRSFFAGFWVVFALSACVRDVPELPGPMEGAQLSGTIVERDPKSGALVPASGIRASVIGTSLASFTNADGFFQLNRLPLGLLQIHFERVEPSGVRRLLKVLNDVEFLVDGQSLSLGMIEIGGAGDLTGRVELADRESPGAAEGTLVALAQTAFRAVVADDGTYLLSRLPEGVFSLTAFRAGYVPARLERVGVSPGKLETLRLLSLEVSAEEIFTAIAGVVRLEGEENASGVAVRFFDESQSQAAPISSQTNQAGNFELTVPVGIYRARFEKAGYRTVEIPGILALPEGVLGLVPVFLQKTIADDLDGDGIPDSEDPDRDNDGCENTIDAFPNDANACLDTDGDMIPNELDDDDDGDGLSDAEEMSPGTDGTVTDPLDPDTDDDGVPDGIDVCPSVPDPDQADRDQDGVGDTCDVEPVIIDFLPKRAGRGTEVLILGGGFNARSPGQNIVQFGAPNGGFATADPRTVTETQMIVRVPPDAAQGPLAVFTGLGSVTSTAIFEPIPPPLVADALPRVVGAPPEASSTICVFGQNFENATASIGNEPAPIVNTTCRPDLYPSLARVELQVPPLPFGEHVIRIDADGGANVSNFKITVRGGPSIRSVRPNPAHIGQTITILGNEFSTVSMGGALQVRFAGAGAVTPDSYDATTIRVRVPVGAQSGMIDVEHPAGTVSTPLTIIPPEFPIIQDMQPTLARVGDPVTIFGSNVLDVTRVRLSGVLAQTSTRTATQLTFLVPPAAAPGSVTLEIDVANTTLTATVGLPLSILQPRVEVDIPSEPSGMGFDPSGLVLYTIEDRSGPAPNSRIVVRDATTLVEQYALPVPIPPGQGSEEGRLEAVAPTEPFGVVSYSNDTAIVDLSTGTPLLMCNYEPLNFGAAVFAPDSSFAVTVVRPPSSVPMYLQKFDLQAGTCESSDGSMAFTFNFGIAMTDLFEVIVARTTGSAGSAHRFDVDPASEPFGQLLESMSTGIRDTTPFKLFFSPGPKENPPNPLYVVGSTLHRFDPFGSGTAISLGASTRSEPSGISAQSYDQRWIFYASDRFTGLFYDLGLLRLANNDVDLVPNTNQGDVSTAGGAAAHPYLPVFVATNRTRDKLIRYEILPAPLP